MGKPGRLSAETSLVNWPSIVQAARVQEVRQQGSKYHTSTGLHRTPAITNYCVQVKSARRGGRGLWRQI